MKVVLVFVSTVDGKVTKWGYPLVRSWSSKEDQEYFTDLWKRNSLIVMGSSTFNADPLKPSENKLLIVMTRYPEKYKNYEAPGQLEFLKQKPLQIIERFEKEGYEQMMVVGGAHVATSFLREELIDEIWLTIEPKVFGTGGSFIIEEQFDTNLRLLSYEKVNKEGTLITKYAVVKK